MKKLILILLFIPLVSFGQNLIEDNIEPFKELISDPMYNENNGQNKSFFKGYWIDTSGILKYRFEHLIKGDIEFTYNKWSAGVSYRYNSFMKNLDKIFIDLDTTLQLLPTGIAQYREDRNGKGDFVYDTRLSYRMTESTKVAFLINNLLNREYMIRPLTIEAPRTFLVQFTIKV